MKLMIVESPNKVKKITTFLGDGWTVCASIGHVRDLPEKDFGVDLQTYIPTYELTERGASVIERIRPYAQKADQIYLATDPDREGEAIAWHLQQALKIKNPLRITFNSITKAAIQQALASPRQIDMQLVYAQEARRVLDRFVGYLVSPILSKQRSINLSAGRVQSPALRIVVEREREIAAFKDLKHFGARVGFDNNAWYAQWDVAPHLVSEDQKYNLDEALAQKAASQRDFTIKSCEQKVSRQAPPAPFTTASLLQAASVKYKFNAAKTQALAQKLFEGGHITYHRTDRPNFSDESANEIRAFVLQRNFKIPEKLHKWPTEEGAQEAHEAIRPTHLENEEAGETEEEKKLYNLIWLRAVASQLEDSQTKVTTLKLQSGDFNFVAIDRLLIEAGWRSLTPEDASDDEDKEDENQSVGTVPSLPEGTKQIASSGEVLAKKTNPPPRYTEARLIKKLAALGVGRPSTYASILNNIIETRNYIERQKNLLRPSVIGETIVDSLVNHAGFIQYDFTRRTEADLDKIAEGKAAYKDVIAAVHADIASDIERLKAQDKAPLFSCPSCGKGIRRINGAKGVFWGCEGYNEGCKTTMADQNGRPVPHPKPEDSKHKCPKCGEPMVRRTKSGAGGWDFWGCTGFKSGCKTSFPNKHNAPDFKATTIKKTP